MRLKPIIFFLIVGCVATYLVIHQTQQGGGTVIRVGQMAPDFVIKDPSGKEVKLSDYRGKIVFLNFWASWCEPCKAEMPDLDSMNASFKSRKFQMLAVST